jgi:hypothetical protein
MKQKEVFNKIGGIIKELNDQYVYLQAETENLNNLELELFISNARFLTAHLEILCKLTAQNNNNETSPTPEKSEEPSYFTPIVQQPEAAIEVKEPETDPPAEEKTKIVAEEQSSTGIDLEEVAPGDSYSYEREEPETIRHELILDDSINWEDNDDDLEEKINPPLVPHAKVRPDVADKKKTAGTEGVQATNDKQSPAVSKPDKDIVTINQKISSQLGEKSNPRTEQLSGSNVNDIKQVITLNDKLLYIKDLFNGYSLAYSEAIDILNRLSGFDEAAAFLNKNYAVKNNWESKPETVEKFYTLLKRRYV